MRANLKLLVTLVRNPNFWLVVSMDILLIILALFLSLTIRFESRMSSYLANYLPYLPLVIGVKIPVFYWFDLYRGMWRYTSMADLVNILKGTLVSFVVVILVIVYMSHFQGYSRSVFILDAIFTFLFISGHRVGIRYLYNYLPGPRTFLRANQDHEKKRLLLIGAGDASDKVIREVHDNPRLPYTLVGIVDDNQAKVGLKIHGIPVVGVVEDLREHVQRFSVQELLIAIASASGEQMKRLVSLCQETGVPFKVLPGLGELIDGNVSIKTIRDISYKDLLGREEVRLEQELIGGYLSGKTVLITGGGGSIGSELCRQVIRFAPGRVIIFDASEENLYAIQMELLHELRYSEVVPVLGKVQDLGLLELVFQQHKPEVVFHAAAYKHVPLVEKNPWQAIRNNVFAAQLLLESSIIHGVRRFVLVSTDKAVRPTNVMGASKRMTELLMQAYGRDKWDGSFCSARKQWEWATDLVKSSENVHPAHNTIFMAVRFGNVLGSSGSVIPLFKRQIEMGGPVTVTHPEITRYFMSIEEAAQLILQAGAMGQGGEIFILKMGEPIQIAQMARDLIRLAGREPDTEIEIKFTGLREGEKLYEELITVGEGIVETSHEKIMVLRGDGQTCAELSAGLDLLHQKSRAHDGRGIKEALQQLIPEYKPDFDTRSIRANGNPGS